MSKLLVRFLDRWEAWRVSYWWGVLVGLVCGLGVGVLVGWWWL